MTRLGKRIYNDELKLLEEADEGRRRYEIYGWTPSFEESEGTDLNAVAAGRIAVTPIHFDLTDHGGIERCAAGASSRCWHASGASAAAERERTRPSQRARRSFARSSTATTASTTSSTNRRSATTSTTRC